MFWLLSNNLCQNYDFYQVFIDQKLVHQDNLTYIYSFETTDNNHKNIYDSLESKEIICEIKVFNNLTSYTVDLETQVFEIETNFINSTDLSNELGIGIFTHKYKRVNTNLMPNIIKSQYSMNKIYIFKIYQIDEETLYILQIEQGTNITLKYYLSTTITNIKKVFL